MKTTIILILFMFSFNCLMAVPVQIKGKVQEKGTGNPIEFADVVLTKKAKPIPLHLPILKRMATSTYRVLPKENTR